MANAPLKAPSISPDASESPRISMIGNRSFLLEAPGELDLPAQRHIWAVARALKEWETVQEIIPGMTNLLVILNSTPDDAVEVERQILEAWHSSTGLDLLGKTIEVPMTYGGEHAIDLPAICDYSGLSDKEVVRIHAERTYTVFAVGSAPGFGYLGGLDPRIFMPRKKVPSLRMLKGMVTIGGMQTGISVLTGPNGWNSLGFADITMFDAMAASPALLSPGDRIRFIAERIEL
ncbi:5-oxoprolinase subunit PxpB [Neorhizobium sp. NCHU2750]|uniref:5-oxoprolinase subunit PxpB n=1 Tax=Neorhizobium sp. NCHU2750 TaxID=1825976 RepID=UPI000E76613C|nr:allophanate hydrolase [Neorhizobium sp. NCHU2750]